MFAVFLGALLVVYRPALDGPFLSDDHHYVERNPFVHGVTLENVLEILQPNGAATAFVANYAPVHLILHMCAWEVFGEQTRGHHVVNLVFHAVVSLLLVALLLQAGVRRGGALLGGVLFLVHPANVEAVAWISQLKSSSALALSLAALLVFRRHRPAATLLFALALLAKPLAAFALPVAFLMDWAREGRVRWRWLALWLLVLAAFAAVELPVFMRLGATDAAPYESPFVLMRTAAAIALRYLVMAASSYGVSAYHEPEPARWLGDPWWLGSIPILVLLTWRIWSVARRGGEELAWWAWVLAAYLPVSQIFPFLYPMADRYLYFMLPGLIGIFLLMTRELVDRIAFPSDALRRGSLRAAVALGVVVSVVFATRSVERAQIWRSSESLLADAATHYPDGMSANVLRAKRAAQNRDVDAAVSALQATVAHGYTLYGQLVMDPAYAPIRGHDKFRALVRETAGALIEQLHRHDDLTQLGYLKLAEAHFVRNEPDAAAEALERAVEVGGPFDEKIRGLLSSRTSEK